MAPDPQPDPKNYPLGNFSRFMSEGAEGMAKRMAEDQAAQARGNPIGGATGLEGSADLIDKMNLAMQSFTKTIIDQHSALKTTNDLQQQNVELQKEAAELAAARTATQDKYNNMSQKEIATKARQLELTKQEDAILQKVRGRAGFGGRTFAKGTPEYQTIERIRGALQAQEMLGTTGLSPQEAREAGGISGHEASVLAGGPERARRLFGLPISEGMGGLTSALYGNPYMKIAMAGMAIAHGLGGMQEQGAAGVFSSIPIIGGTLANLANQIPGLQAVSAFGNTTRLGMVTGDGYRTGLSRQFQAWRMGANPFDIVSSQTANEIVQSVAEQGFRGSQASAFQSAILGGYKQTGLPIQQLAAIGTLFAKNKGLDQFRQTIENIDNVARDSSQSVAAVADQIQTLSETLSGKGAAPLGLASDIVTAVSQLAPNLTPEQQKSLATGFMGQPGMEMFSGFPGVAATTTIGRRIARQNQAVFLRAQRQVLTSLPRDQQDLMLSNLVNAGIFGSIHEARTMIMHGHSVVHGLSVATRRRKAAQSFDKAQRRVDHLNLTTPQEEMSRHGMEVGVQSHAYIHSLTRNLRASGFSAAQIAAITQPLRGLAHGPTTSARWSDAVKEAQKRAIMQAEADSRHVWSGGSSNKGRFLTITFDTRDLGKKVSKTIQLDHARGGSSTYVGTDRTGG